MSLNDIGVDETWSDIVNHEGYSISSYGRVTAPAQRRS